MGCIRGILLFITGFAGMLFVMPAASVYAQNKPFSHIDVYVSRTDNFLADKGFRRYWRPGYGFDGIISTPFYVGSAEVGLSWHIYNIDQPVVPRLQAQYVFAGWGYPVQAGPITLYGGFRVGNYRMDFENDEALHASENDESEFSLSGVARIDFDITRMFGIHAAVSRTTVFTHHRLYFTYAHAGVKIRFKTGRAFQEIMQ